jgi:hypothetical protein
MLEIPDQTQVVDRLDHLADSIGPSRSQEPDGDALAALTKEITALRRRITLRPDALSEPAGAVVAPDDEVPVPDVPVAAVPVDGPDAAPAPKAAAKPRVLSARAPRTPRTPRTAKAAGIRIEDEASASAAKKRPARKASPKR